MLILRFEAARRRVFGSMCRGVADSGRHADSRTTEHYARARGNLDRHGVHFLTAYVAGV